jgi:hypothetical protein
MAEDKFYDVDEIVKKEERKKEVKEISDLDNKARDEERKTANKIAKADLQARIAKARMDRLKATPIGGMITKGAAYIQSNMAQKPVNRPMNKGAMLRPVNRPQFDPLAGFSNMGGSPKGGASNDPMGFFNGGGMGVGKARRNVSDPLAGFISTGSLTSRKKRKSNTLNGWGL